MPTQADIKLLQALQHKKYRQKYNKFVVEGDKMLRELLRDGRWQPLQLYALPDWAEANLPKAPAWLELVDERAMKKLSALHTPPPALALLPLPAVQADEAALLGSFSLLLDGIQDPGNLGTILRIADWFGIGQVLLAEGCADPFGPKAVQASMGALWRVAAAPVAAGALLPRLAESGLPIFGAYMDGQDVFALPPQRRGLLIIGNEGQGISPALGQWVGQRVGIPAGQPGAESLNAAVATGILCAAFRRAG